MHIDPNLEALLREYYETVVKGVIPFENVDPAFLEMLQDDIGFAAFKAHKAINEFAQSLQFFRDAMTQQIISQLAENGITLEDLEKQAKAQEETDDFFQGISGEKTASGTFVWPKKDPEEIN